MTKRGGGGGSAGLAAQIPNVLPRMFCGVCELADEGGGVWCRALWAEESQEEGATTTKGDGRHERTETHTNNTQRCRNKRGET